MSNDLLLWSWLLLPITGSIVCLVLPSARSVLAACCAFTIGSAFLGGTVASRVFSGGPIDTASEWLRFDALSAFHAAVMTIVFVFSSLYAWSYFREEIDEGTFSVSVAHRFGALWLGFLAAMSLVLVSNNLAIMWVGIEGTTLVSAFLICLHVNPHTLEAMWKYLLVCSVGVAFAFLGTLLVAFSARGLHLGSSDTLMWTTLRDSAEQINAVPLKIGFLFLLIGYGTKAGLAPMHTWLPDAHSQSPSPVSAVFSGFLLSTALYCVMRYIPLVEAATGQVGWSRHLLVVFGLLSIGVAAAFIIGQKDIKRLLAYSSVEHIGVITLGLGLGGLGTFAALFHTLNHSVCKPLAFFSAGRLGQEYKTHDIQKMGGSIRRVPLWGLGLFLSLLCLIGVAPFGIFMSEFQIVKAAIDSHSVWTLVLFLLGTSVVFVGILSRAIGLVWGEPSPSDTSSSVRPPVRSSMLETIVVLVPLATLLLLGLWIPDFLLRALHQAAAVVGGNS